MKDEPMGQSKVLMGSVSAVPIYYFSAVIFFIERERERASSLRQLGSWQLRICVYNIIIEGLYALGNTSYR